MQLVDLVSTYIQLSKIKQKAFLSKPLFQQKLHIKVRKWWRWQESNLRPPECKSGALPAELHPRLSKKLGCGDRIWTCDLWVMSPTSYRTAPPRDKLYKWWAWVDSNYRPHAYQACALTNWATGPQVVSQSQRIKAKHQLHSSNQSVKRSITVDYLKTRYVSLRFWPC